MRTAIYIDGFNFFYGAVKNTNYKWLNPKQLCESILKPHHNIISIVYCTAKVKPKSTDPSVPIRQATYLKAIKSYIPELTVIYGHFLETRLLCRPVNPKLGKLVEVIRTEEKGSDVNLAVHLVNDAHNNLFDCAIVVSNDSDLAEAMRIVKDECGKVVGLFTPWRRRASKQLSNTQVFNERFEKPVWQRANFQTLYQEQKFTSRETGSSRRFLIATSCKYLSGPLKSIFTMKG